MDVAYLDVGEAFFLGCLQALESVVARGGGEVVHPEVGMKGQERVGDGRVQGGDETGQCSDFVDVDIA